MLKLTTIKKKTFYCSGILKFKQERHFQKTIAFIFNDYFNNPQVAPPFKFFVYFEFVYFLYNYHPRPKLIMESGNVWRVCRII